MFNQHYDNNHRVEITYGSNMVSKLWFLDD